jgi:eukaryotic-like serine/threonine-protein kinase
MSSRGPGPADVAAATLPMAAHPAAAAGATLTEDQTADLTVALGPGAGDDRYELADEIARGGGGRIVVARDRRLGRSVAVKLPLHDDASALRLVREAQVMARLEHPSIVAVHDLCRDVDGAPFYVMKLLGGQTLRDRIAGLAFDERIALLPTMIAIAEGVAYAHSRGVVHRDLKPGNVIVGEFGEVAIIDWGLARAIGADAPAAGVDTLPPDDGVTLTGAVVGTPAYMPPEQARGEPTDLRSDVYALGAILYQLLGGAHPYTGHDAMTTLTALLERPPTPLTELQPRVPADLAAIVAKAMARDPADRYPTARELTDDLRNYQTGRLVAAHRYTPWARARRWLRRHQVAVGVAALVLAGGSAVAVAWPDRGADPRAMCARAGERVGEVWAGGGAAGSGGAMLDAYAGQLRAARVAACEATHVRGEQSAETLDARMTCLDRRLDDLRATAALLESATTALDTDRIVEAISGLPDLAPCADPDYLRAAVPMPTDAAVREQVIALRGVVAEAKAVGRAGRFEASLGLARHAAAALPVDAYPPLAAEARLAVGEALMQLGRYPEAEVELRAAGQLADAARADVIRGEAMLALASVYDALERVDDRARVLAELEAVTTRIASLELEAYRLAALADLAAFKGDLDEAVRLAERALDTGERAPDRDAITLADLHTGLGNRLAQARRADDAEPHFRKVLELDEAVLGADHDKTGYASANLAALLHQLGRHDEALQHYDRALAIITRTRGPEHRATISVRTNRATLQSALRRYDDAYAELQELLAVAERVAGPDSQAVGNALYNLGDNRSRAKDHVRAEEWFRRALAHHERTLGPDHVLSAGDRWGIAHSLINQGRPGEAVPLLEQALATQRKELGEDTEDVAYSHYDLGQALLKLGKIDRAIVELEAALPWFEARESATMRDEVRAALDEARAARR